MGYSHIFIARLYINVPSKQKVIVQITVQHNDICSICSICGDGVHVCGGDVSMGSGSSLHAGDNDCKW